jgi:type IV pilus assembly protein PilQ
MLEFFKNTKNTLRITLVFSLVFSFTVQAIPRSGDPKLVSTTGTPAIVAGSLSEPTPAPTPARSASSQNQSADVQQGKQYGQPGFVGERINLNVVNADIRDILNYITEQYGVNFIIDSSVEKVPVTVNVSGVPWNQALDNVLRAHRLGIEVNGDILRVAKNSVLAEEAAERAKIRDSQLEGATLFTEIIRLNYARAIGTIASQAGDSRGYAGGQVGGPTGSVANATGSGAETGIMQIIGKRLSRRGSIETDARSNTLIITDVRENIDAIRQLVSILDQPEPQVEIEARIVIASRNFSRDLGFQLKAVVFGANGRGISVGTLPGSTGPGLQGGNNQVPGGIPGGIPGTPQPAPGLGVDAATTVIGLTTGIFGTAQITAALTAAESKGQIKVIASPRLTVLNNRSGQVESGQQIPVVTAQAGGAAVSGAGAGTGQGQGQLFTTTFVSVPLRLSVTPQISDAGTVLLNVTAENNTVNRALASGLTGTPGIDTQRMQTEVLVPDGGTTIVGGVIQDSESNAQVRTPGLSGIPILGNLFKRKTVARNTNEILFFITPRIYRPDYQGNPVTGVVSPTGNRTQTILQPVPLGNPPSNTPTPTQLLQNPTVPSTNPSSSPSVPPNPPTKP